MFTKGKKGFAKRIVAMLMALLMVWSLVPADAYVTWADDEVTYTFELKDANDESVTGATFAFYNESGTEDENNKITDVECTEGEEGVYSVTTDVITTGYWYVITVEGYDDAKGQIEATMVEDVETVKTYYEVTLAESNQENPETTTVKVEGTVVTEDGAESETPVAVENATVILSVADQVKYTATTDAEGKYVFDAVEVDVEYTLKVKHDAYKTVTDDVSLIGVTDAQTLDVQLLTVKDTLDLFFATTGQYDVVVGAKIHNTVTITDPNLLNLVTYSSDKSEIASVDSSTGKVTTHKASGNELVTITASFAGNDIYAATSATYTIKVIEKTTLTLSFEVENIIIKFGDTEATLVYKATMDQVTDDVAVVYSSDNESVVQVDSQTGVLTVVGIGTAQITATINENENYTVVEDFYSVTVENGTQNISVDYSEIIQIEGVKVENSNVQFTTQHISNTAIGRIPVSGNVGEVTFESSDEDIVFIDDNGYITIKKSGSVTITVTAEATDLYNEATTTYTVSVNKIDAGLEFDTTGSYYDVETQKYIVINGDKDFRIPVLSYAEDATVEYSIKSDENGILSDFDDINGTFDFTYKIGEATISAKVVEDDTYRESTAEYTIVVKEWEPKEEVYTVVGSKTDIDSDWYTKKDLAINAKEGYVLSSEIPAGNTEWADTLSFVDMTEGTTNSISFYIHDVENGYISKQYTVENIMIDTELPTVKIVKDEINWVDRLLSFFTFGLAGQDNVEFIIDSKDSTSDVKIVYYHVEEIAEGEDITILTTKEELDALSEWETYSDVIEITPKEAGTKVIYAKVVDNAGNYNYAYTNGLIFDGLNPTVTPTIITDKAENDYYTEDVKIKIEAEDASPSSGINSITYVIKCGDKVTESGDIYTFQASNEGNPESSELVYEWVSPEEQYIVVDAASNNSDNVVVEITITDNAGNSSTKTVNLKIAYEKPMISPIEFVGDPDIQNTYDDVDYYQGQRVAKVVITSENRLFVEDNVSIDTGATADKYSLSEWTHSGDTHTAYITFSGDAKYSVKVDYKNTAGTEAGQVKVDDIFVVDNGDPTGSLSVGTNFWYDLIETLTFGLWKNTAVEVKPTYGDAISPSLKSVEFIKVTGTTKLTTTELANADWQPISELKPISEDEIFVVYMKLVDYAENETFISTDGIIVDTTESDIAINYNGIEPNANGYIGNLGEDAKIPLLITVEEIGTANSGIASVTYSLIHDEEVLYTEELWNFLKSAEENGYYNNEAENAFDENHPLYAELKQKVQKDIVIDAKKYNYDNLIVRVTSVDNAGVASSNELKLNIDVTKPTVELKYDVNSGNGDYKNGYFDHVRTATIKVTERLSGFNKERATNGIVITVKDKADSKESTTITAENAKEKGIIISDWVSVDNVDNPDLATHEATIIFSKDAYYEVSFSYTDNADNVNEEIVCPENTYAPYAFTVDTIAPTDLKIELDGKEQWDELLEVITFGIFKNDQITFVAKAQDATSKYTIHYIFADDANLKKEKELDEVKDWILYNSEEGITITDEQKLVIYLKVTDTAGNRSYIHSKGAVIDRTPQNLDDITIEPVEPNSNGVYNKNVDVRITVNDSDISSGIKEVECWVTSHNEETKTLYEKWYPANSAEVDELVRTINIDASKHNSSDVKIFVRVMDNAGNEITKEYEEVLDIDVTKPEVEVVYDSLKPIKVVNGKGYFDSVRTATITVTERNNHFDAEKFIKSIEVTRNNGDDKIELSTGVTILETDIVHVIQTDTEPADDKHIFTITYQADGNYELAIKYKDDADNQCDEIKYPEDTITSFAVDKTAPTGEITLEENIWASLLESFTFGFWRNTDVNIKITAKDETSDIENIYYYKTSEFTPLKEDDLKKVTEWVDGDALTVSKDDIFVVYAKLVDYAGNVAFIGSNGIIVDKTEPTVESITPQVTITPQQPVNEIYNKDVVVDVSVVEPGVKVDNGETAYSGLKEVRYEVYNRALGGNEPTQSGVLYPLSSDAGLSKEPSKSDLITNWNGQDIVINAELNNSNKVEVVVTAKDNAGNVTVESIFIKIDTTRPTIDISYDNNNGDTTFADGTFFNANRVATITITERNFDSSKVDIQITNSDDVIPAVTNWRTVTAGGNGDNTTHTATITYSADGDYTFDISYSDQAGNTNEEVDYGNALAPTDFTIDKTIPTISVEYDNNDVLNGNYYKADRVGTITITEHNFDESRVNVTGTVDGQNHAIPLIWRSSGDTHTATINYTSDALYTFDIAYTDKAGNVADDFAQQSFYVDKTAPVVTISGIEDQSANKADEIGFVIEATDENFDVFEPVLKAVIGTDGSFDNPTIIELGAPTPISGGQKYTVENIDSDGIYRITCTVVDKAGNAYTEVILENADGETDVKEVLSSTDALVTFSVNREGSTFEVDTKTSEIVKNFYIYEVTEDIVIYEVNTDELLSYEVTLNGTLLVEGDGYEFTPPSAGDGEWKRYQYSIKSSLFTEEGEYTIVISSTDKAENNAFSNVKETEVSFVVDRTAPIVTITGMQDGGRYQADEAQTVTLIPTDDGGALGSLIVRIIDENGNVVGEPLVNLAGDALTEALTVGSGAINFEIETDNSGSQIIEVICSDSTVNADGNANVYSETFEVVVASSEWALVWADTTMRYSIIGGSVAALVLLIGVTVLLVRRKAKKDKTIIRK